MTFLTDATLEGGQVEVLFGDAIQSARETLSIDQAPTITMTLLDPTRELVESKLWQQRSRLELNQHSYTLVQVDKQPRGVLGLTFESTPVYTLRQRRKYRKAYRSQIDRVTFAQSLCRESGVKFHAPEAGPPTPKYQRVTGGGVQTTAGGATSGFEHGAKLKIGSSPARSDQLRNLSIAFDEAIRLRASELTLVGMVMAGIQESSWIPQQEHGGSQHWGIFQQNTQAYCRPEKGDVLQATHEFLCGSGTWQESPWKAKTDAPTGGHSFMKNMQGFAEKTRTLGDIVELTQGAGLGGGKYDQWHAQAQEIVAAYSSPDRKTPHKALLTKDKYEFSRGQPGRPETSWDALGRLASEIGWRRFMVGDTVWFVSDEWLFATPALATLAEGEDAVDAISWTIDVGQPIDGCDIDVDDSWIHSPGVVVRVQNEGPATGKWLVAEWERDLLNPTGTLRLVKPGATIPEPVGDQSGTGFKTKPDIPNPPSVVFSGNTKREALRLMDTHAITTDPGSRADTDLRSGKGTTLPGRGMSQSASIDARIYALLVWLTQRYGRINVSSVMSNHYTDVHGTSRASNHSVGRAMDINRVAGCQVESNKDYAVVVESVISGCPAEFRPTEIGGPSIPPGSGTFSPPVGGHFFTDGDHQNHIHIGFSQ